MCWAALARRPGKDLNDERSMSAREIAQVYMRREKMHQETKAGKTLSAVEKAIIKHWLSKTGLGMAVGFDDSTSPQRGRRHRPGLSPKARWRMLQRAGSARVRKAWQLRKAQLHNGEITKEEDMEWTLGRPNTVDDRGRHKPSKT